MIVLLLVFVAGDLVETELNVGDFARYRVDCGVRPAIEIRHRLCRADGLRFGGLVNGKRIVPERLFAYFGEICSFFPL